MMASITDFRSVLGEATKPVYAWIGAGELAVKKLSPAAVRSAVVGYSAVALQGYADLARRGEQVVGTIRNRTPFAEDAEIPVAEPPAHKAAAHKAPARKAPARKRTASAK
jgi:hypothetical protein